MAKKSTVNVDVNAKTKGFKKVALESKKAGDGLGHVAKNSREADRNIKGAAHASSGASKNFSKMSQGMGGLVGAYATLAANVFAISAAFRFLKDAGDLRVMKEGQLEYARATGESMSLLTARVQEATGQMLSFTEAAQAVQIGRAAGLDTTQITQLAAVAKSASIALGRDLTDSFNRLTRGAIKAEPELLDELGIIVRLDQATSDYAKTVGKTAQDLTTWEKSQAVVNAVIEQGEQKFADFNVRLNQFSRMGKEFDDLLNSIKEMIAPIAEFAAGALTKNITALAGAFMMLGTGIVRSLTPAMAPLEDVGTRVTDARARLGELSVSGKAPTGGIGGLLRSAEGKGGSEKVYLNKNKAEATKLLKFIGVVEKRHLAESEVGWKRWFARRKADWAQMELDHGKTMGRIKIVQMETMRALNAAMSAAAYIGMLFMVIGMVRQLMDMLKDPIWKQIEEAAQGISEAVKTQDENIRKMVMGLHETESSMADVVQFANVIANFEFGGFIDLAATFDKISKQENPLGDTDAITANKEAMEAQIGLLEYQHELLVARGSGGAAGVGAELERVKALQARWVNATKSITNYEQKIYDLEQDPFSNNIVEIDALQMQIDDARGGLAGLALEMSKGFVDVEKNVKAANEPLMRVQKNVERVTRAFESFTETQKKFDVPNTKFFALRESFVDIGEGYKEMIESFGEVDMKGELITKGLDDEAKRVVSTMLGADALEEILALTADAQRGWNQAQVQANAIQEKMLSVAKEIKHIEHTTFLSALKLKTARFDAMAGATSLQKKERKRLFDMLDIQQKMNEVEAAREIRRLSNTTVAQIVLDQEAEKLRLLELQRLELEKQGDLYVQLHRELAATFEKSASTGLADMLKGKEKSLSDALIKIGQNVAEKMADTLAENWVSKLMNRGKQTLPQQIASAGGGAAKSIFDSMMDAGRQVADMFKRAMGGGTTTPDAVAAAGRPDAHVDVSDMPFARDNLATNRYPTYSDSPLDMAAAAAQAAAEQRGNTSGFNDVPAAGGFNTIFDSTIPSEEEKGFFARLTEGFGGIFSGISGALGGAGSWLGGIGRGLVGKRETAKVTAQELNEDGTLKEGFETSRISRQGMFGPVIASFENLFAGDSPFIEKLGGFFGTGGDSFLAGLGSIFTGLGDTFMKILGSTEGDGSGILGIVAGIFGGGGTAANGAIFKGGFRKYAHGGVASSPTVGLIGEGRYNEAIVPLPNGKAIPVDMRSSAQSNNVTVNVSTDGNVQTEGGGNNAADMGRAIARAVQDELQNQKRAGGILNRYGTA